MRDWRDALRNRPKCPFYGFYGGKNIFVDQRGNQCPLIAGYAPCEMKIFDREPEWDNCRFKNNHSLEDFASFTISLHEYPGTVFFREWCKEMFS